MLALPRYLLKTNVVFFSLYNHVIYYYFFLLFFFSQLPLQLVTYRFCLWPCWSCRSPTPNPLKRMGYFSSWRVGAGRSEAAFLWPFGNSMEVSGISGCWGMWARRLHITRLCGVISDDLLYWGERNYAGSRWIKMRSVSFLLFSAVALPSVPQLEQCSA